MPDWSFEAQLKLMDTALLPPTYCVFVLECVLMHRHLMCMGLEDVSMQGLLSSPICSQNADKNYRFSAVH